MFVLFSFRFIFPVRVYLFKNAPPLIFFFFFRHLNSKLRGLSGPLRPGTFLHRHPIDKEKQANKGVVIIYNAGAAGAGLHLTADQSRSFS